MEQAEWQERFSWLEQEQRKDRAQLLALQDRMVRMEGQLNALETQLKETLDEMGRWMTVQSRVQTLEEQLQRLDQELRQQQEAFQRQMEDQFRALQQEMRTGLARMTEELAGLREAFKTLQALEQHVKAREEEDQKLHRRVDKVAADLMELGRRHDERLQVIRLLQEAQERNALRILEIQKDIGALRKRLEELAGMQGVFGETLRKLESRLHELHSAEEERKKEQRDFLEKVAQKQAEQDRQWRTWEARFQSMEELAQRLETHLQGMDAFRQELNRARDRLEDLIERMERRVHEVAEMQRLAEDRFRQEWLTFKADEQKRWANFQLTYEEQQQDILRRLDTHQTQLTAHEDLLAQIKDDLSMLQEQTQKRLQDLHHMARAWLEEYERMLKALKGA